MLFLARFAVLVFTLSWAMLEGAHGCLYLNAPDSLTILSGLASLGLIRRAPSLPSNVCITTVFRRRIDQSSNSILSEPR
jgi:hypothetical protein